MNIGDLVLTPEPGVYCEPYGSTKSAIILTNQGQRRRFTKFEPAGPLSYELAAKFVPALPNMMWPASYRSGQTGSDPELFAFDEHGTVVPAWRWLPDKRAGSDVYWDGVQSEFTTTPSYCHSYVVDSVQQRLRSLNAALLKHNPQATLMAQDVVELDSKSLAFEDDKYINLGCSPSLNVYNLPDISIPNPRQHKYRYSGCHLHFSLENYPTPAWFPDGVVVMLDKILGLCLTALGRDMENPLRRVVYGRPGEYRVPSKHNLRLEYRTPGAYLLHHPALFSFAADIGRAAYRMGLQLDGKYHPIDVGATQAVILACDADAAYKIIMEHESFFTNLFEVCAYNVKGTLALLRIGAKASGLFGTSIVENWRLNGTWQTHNDRPECNFYAKALEAAGLGYYLLTR